MLDRNSASPVGSGDFSRMPLRIAAEFAKNLLPRREVGKRNARSLRNQSPELRCGGLRRAPYLAGDVRPRQDMRDFQQLQSQNRWSREPQKNGVVAFHDRQSIIEGHLASNASFPQKTTGLELFDHDALEFCVRRLTRGLLTFDGTRLRSSDCRRLPRDSRATPRQAKRTFRASAHPTPDSRRRRRARACWKRLSPGPRSRRRP